jgi:hypothetical protein
MASHVKSGRNTFRVELENSHPWTAGRNCAWLTKGYSLRPAVSSRKRLLQRVIMGWGGNASGVGKQSSGSLPSVGAVEGAVWSNKVDHLAWLRRKHSRGSKHCDLQLARLPASLLKA